GAKRYGTLDVTDNSRVTNDDLSYDVFAAVGEAIRHPGAINALRRVLYPFLGSAGIHIQGSDNQAEGDDILRVAIQLSPQDAAFRQHAAVRQPGNRVVAARGVSVPSLTRELTDSIDAICCGRRSRSALGPPWLDKSGHEAYSSQLNVLITLHTSKGCQH